MIGLEGRFWTAAGDLRPTDARRFQAPRDPARGGGARIRMSRREPVPGTPRHRAGLSRWRRSRRLVCEPRTARLPSAISCACSHAMTPSFGTFHHSYRLSGRRARLHAAAGAPPHRRLSPRVVEGPLRGREPERGDHRGLPLGGRGARLRHARAAASHRGHHAPGPCMREGGGHRRAVGVRLPGDVPRRRTSCTWARSATPPTGSSRSSTGWTAARRPAAGPHHPGPAAPQPVPDARLRPDLDPRLLPGQRAVLQRLSLHLRVLRHPRAIRAEPAAQEPGAGGGGARSAPDRRRPVGLLRGRQLHRQPQGGGGPPAPPGDLAETPSLSARASPARPR